MLHHLLPSLNSKKRFSDLTEQEILAVAISAEEADSRVYEEFADALRDSHPSTAKLFDGMAEEEHVHRRNLLELYHRKFGERLPPIQRSNVAGFINHPPYWQIRARGMEAMREHAGALELEAYRFYTKSAEKVQDVAIRKLLIDLAAAERGHQKKAANLQEEHLDDDAVISEDKASHRMFVLQYVQPGLAGLMDGSVATLAPLFAAAFATQNTWDTFLVGVAASVGAGISMGFAEALSDDGSLTGRGSPITRGFVCGIMTVLGGIGHTLPYLIPSFLWATVLACAIVAIELWVIAWIRSKYMDTTFMRATFEVVLGGVLVFISGILIGNA